MPITKELLMEAARVLPASMKATYTPEGTFTYASLVFIREDTAYAITESPRSNHGNACFALLEIIGAEGLATSLSSFRRNYPNGPFVYKCLAFHGGENRGEGYGDTRAEAVLRCVVKVFGGEA